MERVKSEPASGGSAPGARFPLGSRVRVADLAADPYPVLARLRQSEPVSWVGELGMWLVTRYDDVVAVLRDPATYTTDSPHSTIRDTFGPQVLSTDGADHRRYKRACQAPFAATSIESTWGPGIDTVRDELLDAIERQLGEHGAFDLMASLALPLSLRTMGLVLGIAPGDLPRLRGYYESFAASLQNFAGDTEIRERGRVDAGHLRAELDALLAGADAGAAPHSLPARLAGDDGRELSREESINNLLIVLFGGIETTESMIGNTVWALVRHPEELHAIRDEAPAESRARLDAAIEEALRWEPAVQSCTRHATRDTTIAGVDIAAGDIVQCMIGAANRDPDTFTEPDRFDPARYREGNGTPRHLSFGLASHFCLGAWLARLETRSAIEGLLERFPDLRAAPGHDDTPYGHEFRKPPQLWLTA